MRSLLVAAAVAVAAAGALPKELAGMADGIRASQDAPGMSGGQALLQQLATSRMAKWTANRDSGVFAEQVIDTPYGPLRVLDDGVVTQALGVPFAQPPLGDLRFKSPVPIAPWSETVNATYWGKGCIQDETTWAIFTGASEDCLNMQIYAPSLNSGKVPPPGGWPMALFFYGGSWEYGASGFVLYSGYNDVKDNLASGDVIIAATNYRLGAFGFLANEALLNESPDGSVGNYGFQDQRAAMQFLRKIAPAFNGNPNMLTIFGESAGAGSVSNHLAAPRSWGLFERAIAQSGPLGADWVAQPFNISAGRAAAIITKAGCTNAANPAAEIACLRALPANSLLQYSEGLPSGLLEWSPVIDGVEVLDLPRNRAAIGALAPNVPVMLGSNQDEGTLLVHEDPKLNATEYVPAIESIVGPGLGVQIAQEYPLENYASPWWAVVHIVGDGEMTCASRRGARALVSPARNGGAGEVFLYFWAHTWEVVAIYDDFTDKPLGCFHGSELLGVFNLFDAVPFLALAEGEAELAATIARYWVRFMATGNPNGPNPKGGMDPSWAPYNATLDATAVIDLAGGVPIVNMTAQLKGAQCAFWDTIEVPATAIFL